MTQPRRPLAGLRVIEMGWYVAAPWVGLQLVRQGAEVIKVETHKRVDIMRGVPIIDGRPTGADYASFGGGKLSISLDVRTADCQRLLHDLIRISDALIENFSLEAIHRFGLDWETVHALNPRLIMLRMPGLGLEGPMRDWASYGMAMSAMAGLDFITGFPEGPPGGNSISYPDYVAALHGLFALLVALDWRERMGEGQMVEVSQFESAVSVLGSTLMEFEINGRVRERTGNRHAGFAPHGVYRAVGEDRWIAISVTSDDQWLSLATILGISDETKFETSQRRKAHEEELDELIGSWTSKQEAELIVDRLVSVGISCEVVATSHDLLQDAQLRHRKFFENIQVDDFGTLPFARSPISLDGETGRPAPAHGLGEDNERVFKGLLNMSDAEYQRLHEEAVIQ
jgi:benzylsuccinate CoA-transferase BbsF subunit